MTESRKHKRPSRMGVLNSEEHAPAGFVPLSQVRGADGSQGLVCHITRKCHAGEIDSYAILCKSGRARKIYAHEKDIAAVRQEYERSSHEQADGDELHCDDSIKGMVQHLIDRIEQLHTKIDGLI